MHDAAAESKGASDLGPELDLLREDVAKLASQLADVLAMRGDAMWRKARAKVDDARSDVQEIGLEAADAVREIGDNFIEAIDKSVKQRPYAMLAVTVGIGFLLGALWR